MLISEIKRQFLAQMATSLNSSEASLIKDFVDNDLLELRQDADEFNPRLRASVTEIFKTHLMAQQPPVSPQLITQLSDTFKTCLPTELDEKTSSLDQRLLTRSDKAKLISRGAAYGPDKQWKLPQTRLNTQPVNYASLPQRLEIKPEQEALISVITDKDSQNTAYAHVEEGLKPLVMNAANAFHIGGGFEGNYGTQEESLFFTTDLHLHLYPFGSKGDGFYFYDQPLQHHSDSEPNALYTRGVCCFKKARSRADTLNHNYQDCEPFQFDVFTIAGFDLRNHDHSDLPLFKTRKEFNWDNFIKAMQSKFELFFEAALANGNDSVVVAALGCGAFAHFAFPKEKTFTAVATAYAKAISKYKKYFKKIDIVALDPDPTLAKILKEKLSAASAEQKVSNDKQQSAPIQSPTAPGPNQAMAPQSLPAPSINLASLSEEDKETIENVYKRLVCLTEQYLTKDWPTIRNNKALFQEKNGIFSDLVDILSNPDKQFPYFPRPSLPVNKKIEAINLFAQTLRNPDTAKKLATHRTALWIRFVYEAFSIITIIPAIYRCYKSHSRYGTFNYLKAESKKAYDSMDSEIQKVDPLLIKNTSSR